jgi:hypothetical protein|mmetsp:Transcript_12643/g.12277  ORF Transcript_12643/g.12277 Transcript_12643/m.12277 type:complete len:117 (+) Transcript_12643:323-673(+)|eukprot:CAMPEP_0119035022 /NCGR_PEP_ID=MMETSP1177-20130426/2007_1 /TAXON_ID=2985 /ORGANISM="Ochromonas sp, Strain CCMP1899" /LENGTH=116 /DNA_ID=CAMNT_0006992889 /DNA_START=322 /DNA_END=672 /DNA_ORIENTATION=+
MTAKRILKDSIPFHIFIRRQKVLQMYKDFRRASRKVPDPDLRISLKNQIISEFRTHSTKQDAAAIKSLLGEGMRSLLRLRSMGVDNLNDFDSGKSILNDEEDPESGRVGTGWPWSR